MTLTLANKRAPFELRMRAEEVRAVRMFLVHRGRNAWHTTWSLRYLPGYMHLSLESAKSHAERERKQGNVFYVVEIASLAAISDGKAILISELNESDAFSGVSSDELQRLNELVRLKSLAFDQILTVLRHGTIVWTQRSKDSEVVSLYSESVTELQPLTLESQLLRHQSQSAGPTYLLQWSSESSTYSTAALLKLQSALVSG